MKQEIFKQYPHTPFSVQTENIKNEPGIWDSMKVSIFRDEILIGEYLRNYSVFGSNTFYPFRIDEDWYALYSAEYTATRVMKLHQDKIEDWCGEEFSYHGFCPVEFYIPQYIHSKHKYNNDEHDYHLVDCDVTAEDFDSETKESTFVSLNYCNFGFLCGCVWGDDTSWKLRHIDITQVPNKKLIITEKFGYWELPNRLPLRDCISMDSWSPTHNWVELTKSEHINLEKDVGSI